MRKKVTEVEVAKLIDAVAQKVREEMDFDYRVAESQMGIAEQHLYNSLNDQQKELYKDFVKKREQFYAIAREMYKRQF